ncbi:MAG TPA: hypothetical protein VMS31_12720 [Pyrinomonadaceae bacterium]|nr:hypothetical protein [Pyrinomonadaceae bacterium]
MKAAIAFVLFMFLVGTCSTATAQQVYTNANVDYSLELPSTVWRATSEPDAAHEHAEFVNGERLDGYLQVRKEMVDAETTASVLARRDLDQKLRFLPGFVEGKEEPFKGRLSGVMVSYEFIKTGKTMMGRIYYLQTDNRTIYALRFTGLRDKLARIRNQTDLIARSFHIKP